MRGYPILWWFYGPCASFSFGGWLSHVFTNEPKDVRRAQLGSTLVFFSDTFIFYIFPPLRSHFLGDILPSPFPFWQFLLPIQENERSPDFEGRRTVTSRNRDKMRAARSFVLVCPDSPWYQVILLRHIWWLKKGKGIISNLKGKSEYVTWEVDIKFHATCYLNVFLLCLVPCIYARALTSFLIWESG